MESFFSLPFLPITNRKATLDLFGINNNFFTLSSSQPPIGWVSRFNSVDISIAFCPANPISKNTLGLNTLSNSLVQNTKIKPEFFAQS